MTPVGQLAVASAALVGTHFLLSHPLRRGLVTRLGERGFLLLYSVVAIAAIAAMIRFYSPAVEQAPAPQWIAGEAAWIVATLLMWFGSILFAGSFRRNPAFPSGRHHVSFAQIGDARGVFAITRHPMNWGFAIWALVHAIVDATTASLIVTTAIFILAIGGSVAQDKKKRRLLGEVWREWQSRTAFLPFGRGFALPDSFAFVFGTAIFLAATFFHGALGYRPAGIWHWLA